MDYTTVLAILTMTLAITTFALALQVIEYRKVMRYREDAASEYLRWWHEAEDKATTCREQARAYETLNVRLIDQLQRATRELTAANIRIV